MRDAEATNQCEVIAATGRVTEKDGTSAVPKGMILPGTNVCGMSTIRSTVELPGRRGGRE